MSNYQNVFGNATLPPSEYREQTLALTADTTLFWPYNYSGTGGIVAKINKLTATAAWTVTMPDATLVSTGEDVLWDNTSAFTVTIHDEAGGTITTVAAGVQKYIYLTDNSTAAGTWRVFTFGTGTSAADASALAGYGTVATGSTLSGNEPATVTSSAAVANAASRGSAFVFTGGSVALTLPTAVTATNGWYVDVKNAGTGTITITPTGGNTVDAVVTLGLNPNESCRVICDGTASFYTVGLGRSTIYQFTKLVLSLHGLTSYTLSSSEASNKLIQFTSDPAGAVTVTVPTVVAIYYVEVSTSNAYTVTMKTAAGTGVSMAQNASVILYCDGVNVVSAQTSSVPASAMVVNNDAATAVSVYPTWTTAAGSASVISITTAGISFVPSTGVLTATKFAGPVTALKSATTSVDVSAATAPSANQVLTATNSTTATWVTPTTASYPITADKGGTGIANNAASTITITGSFASNFTVSGAYTYTFPGATSTLAALGVAQTWTAIQTFTNSYIRLLGSSTGYSTFTSDNGSATNYTITVPAENMTVGFRNIPQNSQSAAYTTVLADAGKHLLHPSADTTARTFTIDSNANVAYIIGTAITFVNQASAGVMTIAITSDTMRLAGAGTTGSRTLAANGIATALKLTSTEWIISGTGLT